MKKLLVVLGAVAAFAAPAMAADLPPRPYTKAPAVVAVPYSWSGFYVGVHAGGAWFTKDWYVPDTPINVAGNCGGPCGFSAGGHNGSSWLIGGQAGFNYQVANWVIGVEGQASWTDLNGQNLNPQPAFAAFGVTNHTKTEGLGTLAARIGYAVDRTLIFVKGGGAWAHDKFLVSSTGFPNGIQALTDDRFGWMVGIGVEYAFTNNWSVKIEYDHLDFGNRRETLQPIVAGAAPFEYDVRQRVDLVKVGLNYKFGWGGPVVAKY